MGCCNVRSGLIAGAVIGAVMAILGGVLIPVGKNMIKGMVEKVRRSWSGADVWAKVRAHLATCARRASIPPSSQKKGARGVFFFDRHVSAG